MSVKWTRRRALQAIAGCGAAAIGLYTWRIEPHWLEFVFRELPIADLPAEMEGKTLAQMSDVHVGPQVDDAYIVESFTRLQELGPDFVVMTGDWVTYHGPAQLEQLRRVLENAPHGRMGTVGILGNHDYGFRWDMPQVAERVCAIARDAGFHMLRNETERFGGLAMIGVDDLWGPNFRPQAALAASRGQGASIVLCHNPDAADETVWEGYRGWILAGHTHGGQCKPPFLPPPMLPVKNRRYTSGEFALSGGRRMYINRGVGHLLRVRFNARPEITIFRLTRAA